MPFVLPLIVELEKGMNKATYRTQAIVICLGALAYVGFVLWFAAGFP